MIRRTSKGGFTLVEIMIVVAIIGILAAIAIPNFVKARERALTNACIANLKQIEGAIQVWAIDTSKGGTDTMAEGDVTPDYLQAWPNCGDDAYAIPGAVSVRPVCPNVGTLSDHVLP
jgi:prepilin-type N-terminal cleavage/methylation domain-containing protein